MSDRPLLELFLLMAGLSLLSIGGVNAVVPEAQLIIVDHKHWLDARVFSQLFALSQAAPGPNVIFFSAVGLKINGAAGMAAATLGVLGPSSIVALMIGRLCQSPRYARWTTPFKAALAPLAGGLMLASGWILGRHDGSVFVLTIVALSTLYGLMSQRSPLWAIIGGAGIYAMTQSWA